MLDKESAELQAMRAAALKAAQEAESGGPAAVKDGVEGMFAPGTTGEPQKGGASSKPGGLMKKWGIPYGVVVRRWCTGFCLVKIGGIGPLP